MLEGNGQEQLTWRRLTYVIDETCEGKNVHDLHGLMRKERGGMGCWDLIFSTSNFSAFACLWQVRINTYIS